MYSDEKILKTKNKLKKFNIYLKRRKFKNINDKLKFLKIIITINQ